MKTSFGSGPTCSSHHEVTESYTRRVWSDPNGEALVEAFSISGMAHGMPLAHDDGRELRLCRCILSRCGNLLYAPHRALLALRVDLPRAVAPVAATIQIPTDGGGLIIAGTAAEGAYGLAEASLADDEERQKRYPRDPNAVIATAFKAAVFRFRRPPQRRPGSSPRVAPGPIIAAALKAAGPVRS